MDTTEKLPTVISFCSGYGGIERGLNLAGFRHRVISYVEIEAFCCENLATKMENNQLDAAPIWTNIKTFPAHVFRDKVTLITGGYPCQSFSAAGKRKGTDDPRHLWPYIKEHITTIRPIRVFFENVEGHITLGLREVISDLESLGYVCAWGIFSAREVGAPHQRKRVYILADTICKGPQGRLSRRSDTQWQGEFRHAGRSSTAPQWGQDESWPPEPRLGRVVDGCADRVDRIRLLGNAVVPQTAAKAWTTLTKRIGGS